MIYRIAPALALLIVPFCAGAQTAPPVWTGDPDNSVIGFAIAVSQPNAAEPTPFAAVLPLSTASITFDPEQLDATRIDAAVSLSAIDAGNDWFEGMARSADWFNADAEPLASFSGAGARVQGDGYVTDGTLSLRGADQPAQLVWQVEIEGDTARATGTLSVDRVNHNVGASSPESMVARIVDVNITMVATRAN